MEEFRSKDNLLIRHGYGIVEEHRTQIEDISLADRKSVKKEKGRRGGEAKTEPEATMEETGRVREEAKMSEEVGTFPEEEEEEEEACDAKVMKKAAWRPTVSIIITPRQLPETRGWLDFAEDTGLPVRPVGQVSAAASSALTKTPRFDDSYIHFHIHRASSFFSQTAALALSLLVLSARMCSAAAVGKLCEGQKAEAVSRGEVVLDCPVAVDVHQTKQSVVIHYLKLPSARVEVLGCDWMRNIENFDCLKYYGAELIAIKTDRVLARLPEDSLHHNGSYHCEVVPSHYGETFPDCDICYPADPTTTTTTTTTTTATAVSLSDTGDAREGERGGLVTAVVLLSVVVILQLMLILTGMWIFCSRFRRLRGDNKGEITTGGLGYQS